MPEVDAVARFTPQAVVGEALGDVLGGDAGRLLDLAHVADALVRPVPADMDDGLGLAGAGDAEVLGEIRARKDRF